MAVDTFVAYVGVYSDVAHAEKLEARELKADTAEIEADARSAGTDQATAGS